MSRSAWHETVLSKQFYVLLYRKLINFIVLSLIFNFGLCSLAMYLYFNRSQSVYYASDGITPPVELAAMTLPNESSTALLPSYTDVQTTRAVPD